MIGPDVCSAAFSSGDEPLSIDIDDNGKYDRSPTVVLTR